jgi:hypothetical protein
MAAFAVAVASGAALAVPYDPADGFGSIAAMLLANPPAAFFRNLHYWSAQACVVLTVAHAWDRLRTRTERRVSSGVWLRTSLTLPLLAFIMLSGFLLRGDADAGQALRIVVEATAGIPWAGTHLATLAFGANDRLEVVYAHHAATATIVAGLFLVEHVRRIWPRLPAMLAVTLATAALSLLVSPGLHDGADPVVKGPWYFLGLQEILHWTPWPLAAVAGGAAVVGALVAVRGLPASGARATKAALLALLVAYAGLCAAGAFLRGENWAYSPSWPAGPGDLHAGFVFAPAPEAPVPLPVALGRPEGCLVCHRAVSGLGEAHRPEAVGCASCHGGDALTLDKARAHAGMELVPGNLATAAKRCGQGPCHAGTVARVERSVMTTMSGVVRVDRRAFGEEDKGEAHVARLGASAADSHLRQLCAQCHLGAPKTALGPNDEATHGGGCNACHLAYGPAALEALRRYERGKQEGRPEAPTVHPALSLDIGNGQCFGCHNRSARIATSYEGWHELHGTPPAGTDPGRLRMVDGDRHFERVTPDIHHERGLDCIDCHTAAEVMGDGVAHAAKSGQLKVACADCHAAAGGALASRPASALDPASRRLLAARAWPGTAGARHGVAATGEALVNVVIDSSGTPALIRKRTGERRELKPAARACTEGRGHARLSCGSCHTAWAPRCTTCHTSHDPSSTGWDWLAGAEVRGEWNEEAGPFVAGPPTLGVRRLPAAAGREAEVIETFVPGMVMTIDRPAAGSLPAASLFRRLYARIEPHTTRREARPCASCHNDPEALGYGSGTLRFEREGREGRWRFTPSSPPLAQDGLPAGAWIPFLAPRAGPVSTRPDVRPFTAQEQRRVLAVGACLTCHDGGSRVMRDSVRDFRALVARRGPQCVAAAWDAEPAPAPRS